jgi:hypothetical protein
MKNTKTLPSRSQQQVGMRPADATHDGLRKCLRWLDECRKLGWSEDVMPGLEAMFWQYHDSAGNKKPHTAPDEPPAKNQ